MGTIVAEGLLSEWRPRRHSARLPGRQLQRGGAEFAPGLPGPTVGSHGPISQVASAARSGRSALIAGLSFVSSASLFLII